MLAGMRVAFGKGRFFLPQYQALSWNLKRPAVGRGYFSVKGASLCDRSCRVKSLWKLIAPCNYYSLLTSVILR